MARNLTTSYDSVQNPLTEEKPLRKLYELNEQRKKLSNKGDSAAFEKILKDIMTLVFSQQTSQTLGRMTEYSEVFSSANPPEYYIDSKFRPSSTYDKPKPIPPFVMNTAYAALKDWAELQMSRSIREDVKTPFNKLKTYAEKALTQYPEPKMSPKGMRRK